MCHLARSSPEAAYLPLWSSHLGDGGGTTRTRAGAGPPVTAVGAVPVAYPPASPPAGGLGIQHSRFPGPVGQTDSNCSRQLLAGLPPMDVGITGIMPPEVRGWQLRGVLPPSE